MNGYVTKQTSFTGAEVFTFDPAAQFVTLALISGGPVSFTINGTGVTALDDADSNQLNDNTPVFTWEGVSQINMFCAVASSVQVAAR